MANPIIIHDATIVTADETGTIHHDAAIVVDETRIAAIGPTAELLARYPTAERVNGQGRAIFPGFANAHTHLTMTLARGIYEDLSPPHRPPFRGGLAELPLPQLAVSERKVMAELAMIEAIRCGTTLVLEDGAGVAGHVPSLVQSGLRSLVCERAWDRANAGIGQPGPFELSPALADDGIARITECHSRWDGKGDGRIRVGVSAWAPDMCSPDLLHRVRELQDKLGAIATIHLNQVWGEVAAVEEQHDLLPTEYLAREGFLSDRLIAAHCRCMTGEEEWLLGLSHTAVAFNSAIAARRGLSPRISALEDAGCLIAMGSDNMAEDMIEVMRTGMFMERVRRQDGRRPAPEDVLEWATRNGYRALGVPDGGWLAAGNKADLIVVDLRKPHLAPVLRVVSCFIHQGMATDVESVMVDGRWVMRDGRVLTLDEPAVIHEAERVARAAWQRLFEKHPDLTPPPGFDLRPT